MLLRTKTPTQRQRSASQTRAPRIKAKSEQLTRLPRRGLDPVLLPAEVAHPIPGLASGKVRGDLAVRPALRGHTGSGGAVVVAEAARQLAAVNAGTTQHVGVPEPHDSHHTWRRHGCERDRQRSSLSRKGYSQDGTVCGRKKAQRGGESGKGT